MHIWIYISIFLDVRILLCIYDKVGPTFLIATPGRFGVSSLFNNRYQACFGTQQCHNKWLIHVADILVRSTDLDLDI